MMYDALVVILIVLALVGLLLMYRINKREKLIDDNKFIAAIGLIAGFVGWFFSVAAIEIKPFDFTYAIIGAASITIFFCIWMRTMGLWERVFKKCGV